MIAKSDEMKACGVKTDEAIWDARAKCPNGIYLKRDFRWCEVLSNKMLEFVRRCYPMTEYYSIDEFFAQIERTADAEQLQHAFLERSGLPVTIDVGRSRTLAKLFSDTAKRFGLSAVTDLQMEHALLQQLDVAEISGIGHRRASTLYDHHIMTCLVNQFPKVND